MTTRFNTYVIDTNALLNDPEVIYGFSGAEVVIPAAVLKELDRLTEVGTAVNAGEKSLHDVHRAQIEPRDPSDRFRMQKSFGSGHRWSARPLWSELSPPGGRRSHRG